jgi:hypothetical protein
MGSLNIAQRYGNFIGASGAKGEFRQVEKI